MRAAPPDAEDRDRTPQQDRDRQAQSPCVVGAERFRALTDALPQTVFESDGRGRLTYLNRIAVEMFGYTAEQVEAGLDALSLIAPADRAALQGIFEGRQAGPAPPGGIECSGRHRDGQTFPVILYTTPKTEEGCPVGACGIVVDGSFRKRAETEAKKLEAHLYQAQKLESIGTLAGGIAHDFNNLLTGILGGLSLLEFELGPTFPHRKELREVMELVDRGAQLTRQLLGFARRGKYDARPVDLNDVVDKTSRMFGRTRKDIVLRLALGANGSLVLADRTQLEQVLLNLFVNAGQAMPQGGTLELRTELVDLSPAEVSVHGCTPGAYLRLWVVDSGVGMDSRTRDRVFEPFFTTKDPGHGTGLGLASVYGIVKNHGGFVTVESEPGKGAAFCVHLPVSHERPWTRETLAPPTQSAGETILVVDDEDPVLHVTSRLLESLGYRVIKAKSGREAIEAVQRSSQPISLVVLDMVMPEMSGAMTFDALRAIDPSIKVLLSSGYSVEGQATELLERGCNGFIQKPFGLPTLSAKLRELFA